MDCFQGDATPFRYDSMPFEQVWGTWGGWGDAVSPSPRWASCTPKFCFHCCRGQVIACCALSQHLVMGKVTAPWGWNKGLLQQMSEGTLLWEHPAVGNHQDTKGVRTTWTCYRLCALKRRSLHWTWEIPSINILPCTSLTQAWFRQLLFIHPLCCPDT